MRIVESSNSVAGTVIYAEKHGAPGGTADDTAALLAVITGAPEGSTILLANRIYSVQPDAITWNKQGIKLASQSMPKTAGSVSYPTIKLLADGGFGVKIGATANYPTALMTGNGLLGVKLNFNGKKFTEAGLVLYGLTTFTMRDSAIYGLGLNSAGNYGRALLARCLWDSIFDYNYVNSCWNPGASIIELGDQVTDVNGNINNVHFINSHFETLDGKIIHSTELANCDALWVQNNKFEVGSVTIGDPVQNFALDLNGANALVTGNRFNLFLVARYKALFRIGGHSSARNNKIKDNFYSGCTTQEIVNGANARRTHCYDNLHFNAAAAIGWTNESNAMWRFKPCTGELAATNLHAQESMLARGPGWIHVTQLTHNSSETAFVPDIASVAPEKCVIRYTGVLTAPIVGVPMDFMNDFPVDVTVYVRARRTADGATAALQMNCNGTTVAGSAFAALPTAVATVSFDGDGTTVTATKTTHGFKVGDRLIVTGTTSYNTTAGSPVQILTVADANTFAYVSTVNAAAESGSAQKCQWQTISFLLQSTALAGIGEDSADRFRVEYAASNTQAIDIDAVCFVPHPPALHS